MVPVGQIIYPVEGLVSKDEKPDGYIFGRPTKYKPEYCQDIIDFFNVPLVEEKAKDVVSRGECITLTEEEASDMPTMAAFSCKIGIPKKTIYEWAKKHKDFGNAMQVAKGYQENYLLVNGLKNKVNPRLAEWCLKMNHGYKDVEQEMEVKIYV